MDPMGYLQYLFWMVQYLPHSAPNLGNSHRPSVRWLPCLWLPLSTPATFHCGNVWWKHNDNFDANCCLKSCNWIETNCIPLVQVYCVIILFTKFHPLTKKTVPSILGTNYRPRISWNFQTPTSDRTNNKNTSKVSIKWAVMQAAF